MKGDLGSSIHFRRAVASLIAETLPATIELAALAMLIAAALGFAGGLLLFHLRGTLRGEAADLGSTVLMSAPDFLWGLMFILAFGVVWPLLPFTGRLASSFARPVHTGFLLLDTLIEGRPDMFLDALKHMVLPATALGLAFSVPIMRVLRSSLFEIDQADYIRQARLRGVSEGRILLRHALKNAVLPTLTLMGVQFGFLFGGTLLIEVIYSYPGLGNLMVDAVRNADLPIIQAVALAYAAVVLIINMIVDGLYLVLNPRLRTRLMGKRFMRKELRLPALRARDRWARRSSRIVLFCALFAPFLAPHDPEEQNLIATLVPPAWSAGGDPTYLLGTDSLGRDVLSRLFYGARVAMTVAVAASLGAMLIGATLAHLAGYFGGKIDWLIGRAVDVWMSFPPVVLSLVLMTGLGAGISSVILAIVLVDWTRFCRVLRAEVLVTTRQDYVAAARLVGFSHWRTLTREILPATMPLLITLLSIEMGIAVIVEAILSFVGMSVGANQSAWGQMIADARQTIYESGWNLVLPMLAIFITVLGFNLLGDGLRRTLDPRLLQAREL